MTSEEQAAKDAKDRATAASVAADEAAAKLAKANEAQIAADQKAAEEAVLKTPVIINGRAGGAFSIDGPGLGASGTLFIAGRVIPTTRWDDNSIRGILPPNVAGPIRLQTDKGDRTGVFPTPKINVVTKTTTVETATVPAVAGAPGTTGTPGTTVTGKTGSGETVTTDAAGKSIPAPATPAPTK